MLVNIKGAESLARQLRKAVQIEIIDPFVTQDGEEHDPKRGWAVRAVNCIGYSEYVKDGLIKEELQSQDREGSLRLSLSPEEANSAEPFLIYVVALPEASGRSAQEALLTHPALKLVKQPVPTGSKGPLYQCDSCDARIDLN